MQLHNGTLVVPRSLPARREASPGSGERHRTTEGHSPGDDIHVMERAGMEPSVDTKGFDSEAVKMGPVESDSGSIGS